MNFALEIDGDEYVMRYPEDKPYALREQHQRPPGELSKVVLWDVVDVLDEEILQLQSVRDHAQRLVNDAEALDEDDDNYFEELQWLVEAAENLDHIMIDWNGDTGMVSITISDYWYEHEGPTEDD